MSGSRLVADGQELKHRTKVDGVQAEEQAAKALPAKDEALEDVILKKMEAFVNNVETNLNSFEKVSHEFIDQKYVAFGAKFKQFRSELRSSAERGARNAEYFWASFEQQIEELGYVGRDGVQNLNERFQSGTEWFEKTLKKIEDMHIERSLARARDRLLNVEEMPVAWRSNPHVASGYKFCRNYMECLKSTVQLHNETCNIWTHLVGLMVMVWILFWHLPNTELWKEVRGVDRIPMLVFLFAAIKCLGCSVVWHTFCNIRHHHVHTRMACVDYTGIMNLITASILTTEYAALYCHLNVRNAYIAFTTVCGIFGAVFACHKSFNDYLGLRVTFFVTFALCGAIAGFHAMAYEGVLPILNLYLPVIKSLLCYGLGVVVYASRFPERFCKNNFLNYVGMSHNLWHIAVFGGIYYHYKACLQLLEHNHGLQCISN